MTNHSSITIKERTPSSLKLKIFTLIGVIVAILLIIDTVFYFQFQSRISHHIDLIKTQARSLGDKAEFNITKRGGWPFGAWVRIDQPKFSDSDEKGTVSFLGTATRIGGSWSEWMKGFTRYHGTPITFVGKNVIAVSDVSGTATILFENGHFYQSGDPSHKESINSPFHVQLIHIDFKQIDHTVSSVTFHDVKGLVKYKGDTTARSTQVSLESSSKHVETMFHYQNTPIPLEVSHMHLAFNARRDADKALVTLQDYSFQIPSLALSSPSPASGRPDKPTQNSNPVPAIAVSGKYAPDTKSGDITLRIDAWRDLIQSTYHHFGKAITGNEVSPYGDALLAKFFSGDYDEYRKPLIISATIKDDKLVNLDMGVLQPLVEMFSELSNSGNQSQ